MFSPSLLGDSGVTLEIRTPAGTVEWLGFRLPLSEGISDNGRMAFRTSITGRSWRWTGRPLSGACQIQRNAWGQTQQVQAIHLRAGSSDYMGCADIHFRALKKASGPSRIPRGG